VTMGDPAGVGPEIIARAAAEAAVRSASRPVVVGAASTMSAALALVSSPLTLHAVKRVADCRWADGTLEVLDLANVDMAALRRVPELVTRERVLKTIRLAQTTMLGLGRRDARIAVAGLNPHAGEDGLFGDEEKTAIAPAIEAARAEGMTVIGPLPADTLFS